MKHVHELINQILKNPDNIYDISDCVQSIIEMVKLHDEKLANLIMVKLHVKVYGYHFDEYLAHHAVSNMTNFDNSTGEYWTLEQTTQLMEQLNLSYNKYDWYYVLNMLHSDAGSIFKNDTNLYVRVAKALYFEDVDSDDTKAFKHYVAQSCKLY